MIKRLLALLLLASTAHAADVTEVPYAYPFQPQMSGTMSFQNHTINATNDSVAWLYQMPEAATITTACFRYGARALTPVAHKISIQGVSTTAQSPDGTILGGGSPAEKAFTPPADATWDGTWQCQTLDNSISLTRGQFISVVIAPTGTPDGSNNSSFTTHVAGAQPRYIYPQAVRQDAGTWSAGNEALPVFAIKSASRTYGYPVVSLDLATTLCSDSAADEIGTRFSLPSGSTSSFEVVGAEIGLSQTPTSSKTFKVILYNDTTVLQDVTFDTDRIPTVASYRTFRVFFDEVSLSSLTPGTNYIIAIQPQETACFMLPVAYSVNTAAELSAYPGGAEWYYAYRVDTGSWSFTSTKRAHITPIIKTLTANGGVTYSRGTGGNKQ